MSWSEDEKEGEDVEEEEGEEEAGEEGKECDSLSIEGWSFVKDEWCEGFSSLSVVEEVGNVGILSVKRCHYEGNR